jgi:response regulator of citrate/malate metabolism
MVTSEKTMGKIEEAMDSAGANGYICKPFTVDQLQQKLGKIIEETDPGASKGGKGFFGKLIGG